MTDVDDRLRVELHQLAGDVTVPATLPTGPQYRATAKARRTPRLAVAAAVAVVATVAALLVAVGRGASGVPPAEGGPAAWPTRGPLAGDTALINAAMRSWAAAPLPDSEQPPRDVHALYAGRSVAGKTVILTGLDARGFRRIVWLNTDPTSTTAFRHRLHLVADVLAPTGDDAGLIALFGWRPTPRQTSDHVLIALAPPSADNLQWHAAFRPSDWQSMDTEDGVAFLIHPSTGDVLDVYVRSGDSGEGVRVLGDPTAFSLGPFASIDHEADPGVVSEDTSETTCTGNVCVTKLGAGTEIGANSDERGWADLRDGYPRVDGNGAAHGGWSEFVGEAELMAQSLKVPNTSWGWVPGWSRLLADNTGLYLYNWQPSGSPEQLVLYVDRPEWFGGRLGAYVEATGPVFGVGAVVPSATGRQLVVVVADRLDVQWKSGDGDWQPMSVRHNVAVTDVSGIDPSTIRYTVGNFGAGSYNGVLTQRRPATSAL